MDSSLLAPFGAFSIVVVILTVAIRAVWGKYQESEAARITDLQAVLPALTQASAAMQQSSAAMTEIARVAILLRDARPGVGER